MVSGNIISLINKIYFPMKEEMFCGHMGHEGKKETGKLWSTQTIALSLLGLEGHSGFGFHMHSALCCTSQ